MRTILSFAATAVCIVQISLAQVDPRWKPNDPDRPLPPAIEAGQGSTPDMPGRPPSDAIVLSMARTFRSGQARMARQRSG